ncbi:MAG TPA: hypothetical protein VIC34_14040 [Croceibacterium sp.]|jgi:hypothetical protein
MIVDALSAILDLLLVPLDLTPDRKAPRWLWALWLAALLAVLGFVGVAIYIIAMTF